MDRAELKALLRASANVEERGGFVFLVDPRWTAGERREADTLMAANGLREAEGWLCVRTGGTGGQLKFARHDEQTLGAAVRGFAAYFGFARVSAVSVLPLHHVSGLMSLLRCRATGGEFVAWDWKRLEHGDVPSLAAARAPWTISLVPTQLQRLLAVPRALEWLRRFELVLVGGGPLWPQLADTAAAAKLRIVPSYGMTETAAMVTALRPEEFLAGRRDSGASLPHARVTISAEGLVAIHGESLFRGYFPQWREAREFVTQDLGRIDERGHLHVLGRNDAIIITGGRKVQPAEVEAALVASGEFSDIAVIGIPDAEWGEAVVACYPAIGKTPDLTRAVATLAVWQRPKRFVPLADWPRNAQGKIDRAALRRLLK